MKNFTVIVIWIFFAISAFAQSQERLNEKLREMYQQNFSDWQAADTNQVFYPMISSSWKFNPEIHKTSQVTDLESIWTKESKKVRISMQLATPQDSEFAMRMFTTRNVSPPSYKIDDLGDKAYLVKFHDRVEIAFVKENVLIYVYLSYPSKYNKTPSVYSSKRYEAPKAEVEIALKIARLINAEIKGKQTIETLTGVNQAEAN